jgi:hypothetical protein
MSGSTVPRPDDPRYLSNQLSLEKHIERSPLPGYFAL